MTVPLQTTKTNASAFSLVEVAMALGLFSFAVMGLLALLPVALQNHKDAKVDTILAQINHRLAAEVMLTDGEALSGLDGFERMFDAEGRETSDAQQAVYRARIELAGFLPPGAPGYSTSLQRAELFAIQDPTGTKIATASPSGSILVPLAESAAIP